MEDSRPAGCTPTLFDGARIDMSRDRYLAKHCPTSHPVRRFSLLVYTNPRGQGYAMFPSVFSAHTSGMIFEISNTSPARCAPSVSWTRVAGRDTRDAQAARMLSHRYASGMSPE